MVVKKPISLREDLFDYAQDQAIKYFQGNFSMFIGYLISCHKEGIAIPKLENSEEVIKKDKKTDELIDNVEGFFK